MHGFAASKFLRLGFVVLFGAMSVFHFPVMAYGGDAHSGHHQTTSHSHHHGDHAAPVDPAAAAPCDGFTCFLAVEPSLTVHRPLHAVLFGILTFTPSDFVLAAAARPDLPPPRLQS